MKNVTEPLARCKGPCPTRQDGWEESEEAHPPGCIGGCEGTKLVYVYPTLLERCQGVTHDPCEIDRGGSSYEIEVLSNCHGTGYVEVTTGKLEKLWQLVRNLPPQTQGIIVHCLADKHGFYASSFMLNWEMQLTEPERIQALEAAIQEAANVHG